MPNDTYTSGNGERSVELAWNAKTGQWQQVAVTKPSGTTEEEKDTSLATSADNDSSTTIDSASKVNSQSKADSEYIENEFNTLEGELTLTVTSKTVKLKSGQTIRIEGLGKYLSGLYYITAIKRTLNSGGYSHTLTVIKTGFGDSLKKPEKDTKSNSEEKRAEEVEKTPSTTFEVGDKVKFLTVEGNKYTYANASDGVHVPKWVTEKVHTVDGVSSDNKRVRLKEVWSWTYAKYLKKA